jgi:hypothetical protein
VAVTETFWGAPDQGSGGEGRVPGGRIVNLADEVCALPNPDRERPTACSAYPWLHSGLAASRFSVAAFLSVSPVPDRFSAGQWRYRPGCPPLLEDAVARLVCETVTRLPVGDHDLFVGRILESEAGLGRALVFHDGLFGGANSAAPGRGTGPPAASVERAGPYRFSAMTRPSAFMKTR